jgi:hypothetical protein
MADLIERQFKKEMGTRMFKRLAGIFPFVVLLAACGSGGDDHTPTAGTGGSGSGGTGGNGGGTNTPTDPVYSLGSGSGGGFQAGAIAVNSTSLSAGGSTSLSVSVVDQTGVLYTSPVEVSFNSACVGQNLATVTSPITTSTGIATTTYVARGCNGADSITATATVGSQSLIANGTVTVAPAAIGSIEFVSASHTNISLRGAGGPDRPETSTVVFRVRDSSNGPRVGATVNFMLQSPVGGVTLNPTTAISDATGLVQTVVSAGTVASTVSVTATVQSTSPVVHTQSSPLTITTGIVDGNSISLAVECQNVEGLDRDGEITAVTVRMADRFNNPVPDGTAANFRTEGGSIGGHCITLTNDDESGLCTVNWRSQNPRPANGRSSLLVTATGEESFTDTNGNGIFNDGETLFDDLGEPFLDENEDGVYQVNEPYLDFGGTPNVRDNPDTQFNGVLCTRTSAPECSANAAAAVSSNNLIIMSGSTPVVDLVTAGGAPIPPEVDVGANESVPVRLWVRDRNDNVMAGTTTINGELAASGVTLASPSRFVVPCTNIDAGLQASGITVFTFTLTGEASPLSGVLNVTITTPSGLATTVPISINPP